MTISVLGLATSTRRKGNSDLLLEECLRGAADAGARTELFDCRAMKNVTGCIACNACFKTGRCAVKDDMQPLFDKMLACDRLVFATPVFFMSCSWLGKIVIDRCQCFWANKYVLERPLFDPPREGRQGVLLAVAATRGRRLFDGLIVTMKHYFDALELDYAHNLFVRGVDGKGEVLEHPTAMTDAYALGGQLAAPQGLRAEE